MNSQLQDVVQKSLDIHKRIKDYEELISPLKKELEDAKELMMSHMSKEGMKEVIVDIGKARWQQGKTASKLDEDMLKQVLKKDDLSEYKKPGKSYDYVRLYPKKDS